MHYLVGIDLGTSAVKASIFEAATLRQVSHASHAYPIHHPRPNFAEQDPNDWWQAVSTAVSQATASIDPNKVAAIGVDGQMHGLVCVDRKNEPICPAIIWSDSRSVEEVKELQQIQSLSANVLPGPPATGFAASSLLWLSHHQPEMLQKTAVFLQPKDFIQAKLTGVFTTESSDASASWLYDISAQSWADELLTICQIRREQLPTIVSSTAIVGTLRQETAVQFNLPSGIPVVAGAADLAAQTLGHGINNPNQTIVTVGSGGQVVMPVTKPTPDPQQRTYIFNHCLPNLWYKQAAILSGGLSLRWMSQLLSPNRSPDFNHLSTLASTAVASQEGLFFLPYLSGERTPHMNPNASALFFGLRDYHSQAHLIRAVMEGVGFAVLDCLNVISSHATGAVVLSGGITQSPFWCQLMADIWQRPLRLANLAIPRAALGSAILAGLGVGLWQSFDEIKPRLTQTEQIIQPNTQRAYGAAYEKYGRLYQLLKDEMGS